MVSRVLIKNPKNGRQAWFSLPLYFGKLSVIGLSGSYDDQIEIVDYEGTSFIESNSSDPKELLNAEFDDCSLYYDVATDRDLGQYIVEDMGVELSREQLERYLDYEKFGRDVRLEEGGSFVDKGYFVSR